MPAAVQDVSILASSRSPSPAPPRPTAATPGPRAAALQKLHADAINHILKTCSYANFSACFPTPAREVPGSVKHMHEQFVAKLGASMHKEFDAILDERSVVPSLNELDALIEDARRRKTKAAEEAGDGSAGDKPAAVVPPHTLPARQLFISHLAPNLTTYAQEMKARQDEMAAENQELIARVLRQRTEIKQLMEGLDGVVKDLNASVEAMTPEVMAGLRSTCRDVDEEMR